MQMSFLHACPLSMLLDRTVRRFSILAVTDAMHINYAVRVFSVLKVEQEIIGSWKKCEMAQVLNNAACNDCDRAQS